MAQESTPGPTTPAQSQSLYRKYRPASFDPTQLVGQEHVARTLRNAIVMDRVAHAYLFCGPRGTGKTSTARLLAKAVNCQAEEPAERPCNQCASCQAINSGSVVDIIEIDAASNRGVDDIRDLREKVRYAPTQLDVKFYIIDEAHQLTRDAFNAFLKTLEEPPGHVKFVLATTEADKLPDTVASRCQRFDFRRIPVDGMLQHLGQVCESEGIEAEEEALRLISRHATGSLRDALGLLDQLALYGEQDSDARVLTAETVRQVLGLSDNDRLVGLITAIAEGEPAEGLRLITEATDSGEDIHQLNRQVIGYLRLLLHVRAGGTPPEADDTASQLAQRFSLERLTSLVRTFSEIDAASNRSSYPQLPLELALVRAIAGESVPIAAAESREPAPAPAPPPPAAPKPGSPAPTAAAAEPKPEPATPEPAPPSPAPSATSRSAPPAPQGDGMLEHLVANWSHIRRDVKAENSRIAALLSSADPAAVTGDQIILAAPYEFHRNKLNEDNVRQVLERILKQYTHSDHNVVCMSPDDVPDTSREPAAATSPQPAAVNGTSAEPEPQASEGASSGPDDEPANGRGGGSELDQLDAETREQPEQYDADASASGNDTGTGTEIEAERIQAAKRIFEAREIE